MSVDPKAPPVDPKAPKVEEVKLTADDLKAIRALPDLMKNMQGMGQGMAALNRQLEGLKPKQAAPAPKTDDDEDPELMTNAQLLKRMEKIAEGKVKPVKDEGDAAALEAYKEKIVADIKAMQKDHADFDEWRDEMKELNNENPNMSVKRLYALARLENPKKAKELDAKHKKAADEDEDETFTVEDGRKVAKKAKPAFGGLTPTSGKSGNASGKKLSKAEAVEDAWRQTMSDFSIN